MWIGHPDCHRLIEEVWKRPVYGCPMSILSQKLKALKAELRTWNKLIFGNIHLRVEAALAAVDSVQQQINDNGASDDLMEQEGLAQTEL